MTTKVTDLEFRLYEALHDAYHKLGDIYQVRGQEAQALDHPKDAQATLDGLLSDLVKWADEEIWTLVYGDDDVIEAMNRERARRRDALRDDFERVDLRRRAARNGYTIMTDEAGKVYIANPATNQLLPVEDWAGAEEWLNGLAARTYPENCADLPF